MTGFNYTVKQGDKGLSYILLEQAKAKAKADGKDFNAKSINWTSVFSTLKGIQAQEAQEGQKLYYGGDKRMGIKVGQQIDLSAEQMNQIYKSMGLDVEPPSTVNQLPELPEVPDEPEVASSQVEQEVVVDNKSKVTPPSADTTTPLKDKFPPARAWEDGQTPTIQIADEEIGQYKKYANKKVGGFNFNEDGYCVGKYDQLTGRPLSEITRNDDGSIKTIRFFTYDNNGNRIAETFADDAGEVWWQNQFEYDASGNMTKKVWYNGDGALNGYQIYEYDEKGNRVKSIDYDSEGVKRSHMTYQYDETGRQIGLVNYDEKGDVKSFEKYEFSENQLTTLYYSSDGTLENSISEEFDSQGRLVKKINKDGSYSIYTYDRFGKQNVQDFEANGQKKHYNKFSIYD